MNSSLILLVGIVPMVAYVLLDSFTTRKKALWSAMALAIGELVFTLVRFGSIDYLTGLSFLLLAIFLTVSLKTGNDFYFKIQGAILNSIFACVILGADWIFDRILILDMLLKYVGLQNLQKMNPTLTLETTTWLLTLVNSQFPWWLIVHSAVTVYAAAKWNKWVWICIRIPGLYLALFLMMMAISFTLHVKARP